MSRSVDPSSLAWLALAACVPGVAQCTAPSRFALRAPVTRDDDDRPLARRPAARPPLDVTAGADEIVLRPLARAFLFEHSREAGNVNALDEVPDSSWFTNRRPSPEETVRGPCGDVPAPQPPLVIRSGKSEGATPGFNVVDALGRRYVIKFAQHPEWQPEINAASDTIGARLYWAAGYNAPCNRVLYVAADDFRLGRDAYHSDAAGRRVPLGPEQFRAMFSHTGPPRAGRARATASLLVEGEPIGTWSATGVRADDPNDVIPHEDRRELRGERFLAAWTEHWDVRSPNSLDTFVSQPGGGGYVRHWMIDFGDLFGTLEAAGDARSRRLGYTSIFHPGRIAEDFVGFGLVRRPWDEDRIDPRYPNLGYYDYEHFDPMSWEPLVPSTRFGLAQREDLGWMARKIARITPEHLRALVPMALFSNAAEAARLLDVLLHRRERILRWAFDHSSALTDVRVTGGDLVCAADLGLETGLSRPETTAYAAEFRVGEHLARAAVQPTLFRGTTPSELCVRLPPHFAPATAADDAAARYATLDLTRAERHAHPNLRAHFYDLGPARGYVLVGLER